MSLSPPPITGPPHAQHRLPQAKSAGSRSSRLLLVFIASRLLYVPSDRTSSVKTKRSAARAQIQLCSAFLFAELRIYDGHLWGKDACDACVGGKKYSRCGIWFLLCETVVSNDLWGWFFSRRQQTAAVSGLRRRRNGRSSAESRLPLGDCLHVTEDEKDAFKTSSSLVKGPRLWTNSPLRPRLLMNYV